MKTILSLCVIALLALPAAAVDRSHVRYFGGTAPGVKAGVVGRIDTTSETSLIFEHSGNKIAIPYASIESFQLTTPVARHLGILPTIAIALLKVRQHRHFFRISYLDQTGDHAAQMVILEVPKGLSPIIQAVLEARAPQHTLQPSRPCCCSSN